MRAGMTLMVLGVLAIACEQKRTEPRAESTTAPLTPSSTEPSSIASAPPLSNTPASNVLPAFDAIQLNLFAPIPEGALSPVLDEGAKLGQMLYFDARLSRGHDVSCASCHDLAKAGTDAAPRSIGTKTRTGKRNTPTIINAAGAFAQGWDARSSTMEDFIGLHLVEEAIMGLPADAPVVATLSSIPEYARAFAKAFPDQKPPISKDTVALALAAYTKKLFARSRWDRYLAGEKTAVTETELIGFAMFVEAGCTSCHQGKYVGGTQSQKLGVARPWPPPAGNDLGRFDVTKQDIDKGMFKVPTLRNVTRTAPYLHDGSVATLDETVLLMARHQAGRELSRVQVQAIVAFLGTLDGDPAKSLAMKPALPPPSPKTPKPD